MNEPIMMTPQDIINIILAVCAAIITLSTAMGVLAKVVERFRKPGIELEARIEALEAWKDTAQNRLNSGDAKFDDIATTNKALLKSMFALMSYELTNSDKEHLRRAMEDLQNYTVDK